MKKLRLLKLGFLIALLLGVGTAFAQEDINPINILMPPTATDCGMYDVDLLVQQYIDVANISMTLDLGALAGPGVYAGITLNPAIGSALTFINADGQLKLGWSSDPFPADAITLPDNTVLFTLHFDVNTLWGTSQDLAWDDVLTIDCELSGPNGFPIYPDYWNDLHWDIQDQLTLSHEKTDFQCPLDPTGSIDLTVTGGVAPYTYAWTGTVDPLYPAFPGSAEQDLTGLFPGVYCVTVTDADFCVVADYCVTIEQIMHPGPREIGGPVEIASAIQCAADAVTPALPVIEDECGTVLQPEGPTMGGTYIDCEGTITYTYVYTDYIGQTLEWVYTYTVERLTPPAEFGGPAETASTVECLSEAVAPILPVVKDVCGNTLTDPTLVVEDANATVTVFCEGTRTYTYTYTDCAGLTFEWVYTYTIDRTTAPAEYGGPVAYESTVECITDAQPPTLPVVRDVCGVELFNPVLVEGGTYVDCEGTKTFTYTWTDCAGLSFDWTYTYTIERSTAPAEVGGPVEIASTVECLADAVAPTLPVVEDVCGNVLPAPDPVVTNPSNTANSTICEGSIVYTYTYVDCAGLEFVWVYTYTLEHVTAPAEVGGPVEIAGTVECEADAVAPGTVYQAGFAGDFDPVNWTLFNDNGGDGYVDVTGAPASIVLVGSDNGSYSNWTYYSVEIPVDGTLAFDWAYTSEDAPGWDGFGYDVDGAETFLTVTPGESGSVSINVTQGSVFAFFVATADGLFGPGITITDAFLFTSPAFPVVADVCGNILDPVGPVVTGTYDGCEGTKIYTYTYTDCAGLEFVWDYTYTIEHSTPPAEVGAVEIAGTVECAADAVEPAVLPVVADVCGNVLDAPVPVMSDPIDCEGFITYTYTYTDCAGLEFVWVYTYTLEHVTAPAEVGGPVQIAGAVECEADAVAPGTVYQAGFAGDFDPVNWVVINTAGGDGYVDASGAPVSVQLFGGNDGIGGNYTNYQTIIPIDGTLSFDWNYESFDVNGPYYDQFGYTIDGIFTKVTFDTGPGSSSGPLVQNGSVSINVTQGSVFALSMYNTDGILGAGVEVTDAFLFESPAFPVVADVCGNILDPVGPVVTGTYDGCEGTKIYTYTYTDCAGLEFVWDYTYTIEHSTPPAEVGGPVEIASTVECFTDIVDPVLPVFADVCGSVLAPVGPEMSGTYVDCEGTVIYTYTYTDCAGLFTEWVYTYTIEDTQAPWITAPADLETVYMNDGCTAINVDLGTPAIGDNCQNQLTVTNNAPDIFPEGLTVVTWKVEDCAGNIATDVQYVMVVRNTLSGTLVYNNILPFGPDKIMNNVQITLYDEFMAPLATSTTDYLGNYSFPDLCAGNYSVAITNNNKPAGGVNITDAGMVMVFGAVANPDPIEVVNWFAGDVDQSCVINTFDVAGVFSNFVYGVPFAVEWNYHWAGATTNDANTCPDLPMTVTIGGGNLVKGIFGQCTGDFNGNFAPGVMKSNENLTLEYGEHMLVSSGSEFELPVYAGMDMEVGAVSLIMNFPAGEVEITDVFLSSDPSSTLEYNVVGNELRIGWYSLSPVGLKKGESLVTIKMKTSSEEDIMFSLADSQLNELADGNFDVIDLASLIIDIPSTSATGIGVNLSAAEVDFASYPNPFKGTTTLTYSLPVDGQVLIEVYDLLGGKVKVAVDETQSAGEYSLNLDANNLQPGIYTAILKLKGSDDKVTTRAIKMISR